MVRCRSRAPVCRAGRVRRSPAVGSPRPPQRAVARRARPRSSRASGSCANVDGDATRAMCVARSRGCCSSFSHARAMRAALRDRRYARIARRSITPAPAPAMAARRIARRDAAAGPASTRRASPTARPSTSMRGAPRRRLRARIASVNATVYAFACYHADRALFGTLSSLAGLRPNPGPPHRAAHFFAALARARNAASARACMTPDADAAQLRSSCCRAASIRWLPRRSRARTGYRAARADDRL